MVAREPVGPRMAAWSIRYVELARALREAHEVELAAPDGSEPPSPADPLTPYDPQRPRSLVEAARRADAVVAPPIAPRLAARLPGRSRPWVVDLHSPEPFEGLAYHGARSRAAQRALDALRVDRLAFAARTGSAFVCASERQRDMWLGFLAASRRIDTALSSQDPELRSLIDVVPYGVPDEPPPQGAPELRGRVFPEDARIMVWNGGLWDWLDPITVLDALRELRATDARWTLAFSGGARPSGESGGAMAARVLELAREPALAGAVHVAGDWTPYQERHRALLEADVGVSAHLRSVETRFAFRNRMLDFLWTGTPVVATEGDEWAERIRVDGWGSVVPPGDPVAFAAAVGEVGERGRDAYRERLLAAAEERRWSRLAPVLARLVESAVMRTPRRSGSVARALATRHTIASYLDRIR
jgi:glycosyltransferase involved in cell wall biosynthesis